VGGLVSPSWQCSSTPVSFGQGFIGNEYVTTLDCPPYSPDLAPADFYLFPLVKLALKGQCFCGAEDIMKNNRGAEKAFQKLLPGMFPTPLQLLSEVYSCKRSLTILKEMWLKLLYCLALQCLSVTGLTST